MIARLLPYILNNEMNILSLGNLPLILIMNESQNETSPANIPPKNKVPKKVAASTSKENKKAAEKEKKGKPQVVPNSNFPRHSLLKALRIPKAILEKNAGRECSEKDASEFLGVGLNGPFRVEISSSIKFGLLERPTAGMVKPTELSKRIIRPQSADDELAAIREAVLNAPVISDVYKHYRGENLPDNKFFENALTDTFKIPIEKIFEFNEIFKETLTSAKLIEKVGEKFRILDINSDHDRSLIDSSSELKKLSKGTSISSGDSCFVMMPFAPPLGDYYSKIYEPAITKA
ncbi:hypothetical protein [Mucilaginibacter sp. 44-25]|uniref:hypothetical protein n=1 Tax=Mucilaginibacter sp. 44-25 TaxID=1895794 RepID=UPI0025E47FB6|nr:hypothetical protein [Mucilaginibacter sp. 44-25]